jgi:hypothetical protein
MHHHWVQPAHQLPKPKSFHNHLKIYLNWVNKETQALNFLSFAMDASCTFRLIAARICPNGLIAYEPS